MDYASNKQNYKMTDRLVMVIIGIIGTAIATGIISLVSLIWSLTQDFTRMEAKVDTGLEAMQVQYMTLERRVIGVEDRLNRWATSTHRKKE